MKLLLVGSVNALRIERLDMSMYDTHPEPPQTAKWM